MNNITIGGQTQPAYKWANDYNIPLAIFYKRIECGITDDRLLEPIPSDELTAEYVHNHWGKFIFKSSKKSVQAMCYYRGKEKWVYG